MVGKPEQDRPATFQYSLRLPCPEHMPAKPISRHHDNFLAESARTWTRPEPDKNGERSMKQELKLHYAGQILSKKNRHTIIKIGGHSMVRPDNEAKANEDDMVAQFRAQLLQSERRGFIANTKEKRILQARKNHETYTVDLTIYEPNRIRRDLDNQTSTLMDALTRSGAIADDCWQFVKKITVEAGGVSPTPGADIKITIESE